MRNLVIGMAAAASLFGGAAAVAQTEAPARLISGVDRVGDAPKAIPVQFYYSGQQYCWYPTGWKGPGFYYCGYAWRRGYGWGGPVGWMGYSYRGGSYYHGGAIYRGGAVHYSNGYVNGGRAVVAGPNGVAHGAYVNGPNGGRVAGGVYHGANGSVGAARVTGPAGNTRTVVGARRY